MAKVADKLELKVERGKNVKAQEERGRRVYIKKQKWL